MKRACSSCRCWWRDRRVAVAKRSARALRRARAGRRQNLQLRRGCRPSNWRTRDRRPTHIFKRAGISVEWIDCRVPRHRAGAVHRAADAGRDLMLRLLDRAPAEPAMRASSHSGVDARPRAARRRADDDRPVARSRDRQDEPHSHATLLGRAIAHEIGHLLLGSRTSARGLMRALWSQDELRGLKPAHWQFSPARPRRCARDCATGRTRTRASLSDRPT